MGRRGGPQGDLFIVIDVREDAVLQREGEDIVVRFPLSVREAVEGARIQVPTLGAPVSVTIPAGSRSGTRLRLKGQGLVSRDGTRRGHQYIEVEMDAPADALERLADWIESNAALADRMPPEREQLASRVAEDLKKGAE
jgi:molecular chaperone DnaJ